MLRDLRSASSPRTLLLLASALLVSACNREETVPQEQAAPVEKDKPAEKDKPKAAPEAAPVAKVEPPQPLPAPTAPQPMPMRDGAPVILAQFTAGVIVPIASRHGNQWGIEEPMTLDKMPEVRAGKDAAPEVLIDWWRKLDVQDGDTFQLRGDRGAEGTFRVKREFGSADRGGCVGLVWAIPGEVKWTTKPSGSTRGGGEDGPGESVWAFRGPWTAKPAKLARDLSPEETQALKQSLSQAREVARKTFGADAKKLQECDSLNDPPCKTGRGRLYALDLEGDGKAEALATISVRPEAGHGIETRLLYAVAAGSARVMGRWDGDSSKSGDDAQAPIFAGLLDVTGDGRSEIIFRRVANETENWEVFQASPEKPGEWHSLFKTQIEGC